MDFLAGSVLPPPTPEKLNGFENYYLDKPLPRSFRRFLEVANGGVPVDGAVELEQIGREVVIERFLPMLDELDHPEAWSDVEVVTTQLDGRLASSADAEHLEMVPFAALFAGDYLMLDYRVAGTEPGVSVWYHELSTENGPHAELVADTFSGFLSIIGFEQP